MEIKVTEKQLHTNNQGGTVAQGMSMYLGSNPLYHKNNQANEAGLTDVPRAFYPGAVHSFQMHRNMKRNYKQPYDDSINNFSEVDRCLDRHKSQQQI